MNKANMTTVVREEQNDSCFTFYKSECQSAIILKHLSRATNWRKSLNIKRAKHMIFAVHMVL